MRYLRNPDYENPAMPGDTSDLITTINSGLYKTRVVLFPTTHKLYPHVSGTQRNYGQITQAGDFLTMGSGIRSKEIDEEFEAMNKIIDGSKYIFGGEEYTYTSSRFFQDNHEKAFYNRRNF